MSPEAQRVLIAEACGWEIPEHCYDKRIMAGDSPKRAAGASSLFGKRPGTENDWTKDVPDYLNDLNVMHEAEKTMDKKQREKFAYVLSDLTDSSFQCECGLFEFAHATAGNRAEAFLRVIGKWSDA